MCEVAEAFIGLEGLDEPCDGRFKPFRSFPDTTTGLPEALCCNLIIPISSLAWGVPWFPKRCNLNRLPWPQTYTELIDKWFYPALR